MSGSSDRTLRWWDINTGKQEKSLSGSSAIHSLDMCSSDSVIVTGHKTGDLRIWSATQQSVMHTIPNAHSDKIICVKFSSSGREIFSLGRDHTIKITDANTYKEIATLESPELSIPTGDVSFGLSPGGKFLSVGSQSGALCIFNIKE